MGVVDCLIEKLVDKGILTRVEASKMYEESDNHIECADEAIFGQD